MKEILDNFTSFLESKPVYTGVTGMVTSVVTSSITFFEVANRAIAFTGAIFGAIAGFYTMLIVIRNYKRGKVKKGLD